MTVLRRLLFATLLGLAVPAMAGTDIEVGFSPEGSARQLVLNTIDAAQHSIQILAYAFQATDITQALVAAKKRGVNVRIVIDKKRNLGKASKKAMDFVSRNGVELRTSDHFHLQHDKTIIVDGSTIETGSFNYAASAETANSENLVIIRNRPEVARQYLEHWQSRWELGVPYSAR